MQQKHTDWPVTGKKKEEGNKLLIKCLNIYIWCGWECMCESNDEQLQLLWSHSDKGFLCYWRWDISDSSVFMTISCSKLFNTFPVSYTILTGYTSYGCNKLFQWWFLKVTFLQRIRNHKEINIFATVGWSIDKNPIITSISLSSHWIASRLIWVLRKLWHGKQR